MKAEHLIRNARVLDPAAKKDEVCNLLLCDGRIAAVGVSDSTEASVVTDAAGLTLVPGFVDMHVHLRDPGFTHKEDFQSGAQAAAAGGVTSLLAMPNTNPAVDTPQRLADAVHRCADLPVRVYHCAAASLSLEGKQTVDFDALAQAGAAAFSDDGKPVFDAAQALQVMRRAQALGLPYLAHCEDVSLTQGEPLPKNHARQPGAAPQPAAAEDVGTARELALSMATGLPVHICHVSTRTSIALIRAAKRYGAPVTAETAPHYFSLTEEKLLTHDANFRMNPPLRTHRDVREVIRALQDGTIDAIATDHAPHTVQEKADFRTAPNGVIGMETSLAAGITFLVRPGHLTLARLVELMSTAPARMLGIAGGTLSVGAQADFVLLDPQEEWVVDPDALHGKSKNCPFAGQTLTGKVKQTFCRGIRIYSDTPFHSSCSGTQR